jgi:hypothetical protein
MALTWGQKAEIKEDILLEMAADRAYVKAQARVNKEREVEIDSKAKVINANLDAREAVFNVEKDTYQQTKDIAHSTEAAEKQLEAAQEKVSRVQEDLAHSHRMADLDIREQELVARENAVTNRLNEKDLSHAATVELVRMEERTAASSDNLRLQDEVATHKAASTAKDEIIKHKDATIDLLTETLKVTMGKLTQVDLKGVTIHVEAAKPAGKDNSGKQEQKQN